MVAGARSKPLKYSASGSPNESADTPYDPVGLKDAHCLPLLISGAGGRDARSQPIKYSASGSPNESADTPYNPVGGPQGLQDAHGLPLLVPGASGVGQNSPSHVEQ